MADRTLLRRFSYLSSTVDAVAVVSGATKVLSSNEWRRPYGSNSASVTEKSDTKKEDKWFTLPPFTPAVMDGAALGKNIARNQSETAVSTLTALKWVVRCCPELPRSLVQKLFRLRQVRRDSFDIQAQQRQFKRVSAKNLMNPGDRIFLPVTVEKLPSAKAECNNYSEEEMEFLHSLVVYKDPAIIVVNKPHGMAVQGGIGIKRSLDMLAAEYLRFGSSEFPRLVHRLDRDCSGVLVMGRTQLSTAALHSIFREKTFEASEHELKRKRRIIQKTYWALVIGSPKCPKGLISKPLGKVVIDKGESDRITVFDNNQSSLAQCALTEYKVIGSSWHGYTWLELSPITGRKHQLRVHCAEVLGTPIVGDYKYGWQAHRNTKQHPRSSTSIGELDERLPKDKLDPFGLDLRDGSLVDKQPRLHLHCKEMILPDICGALKRAGSVAGFDPSSDVRSLKLKAPLPSHMQKSWDSMNS